MRAKGLHWGMLYVNKYNTEYMKGYIERLMVKIHEDDTPLIDTLRIQELNGDCDVIHYGVYGKKAQEDMSIRLYGAVTMLMQLQAMGKVNKGE